MDSRSRKEDVSTNSSNTATFVKLEHHRKQDMLPDAKNAKDILANTKDAKDILPDTLGFRAWRSNMFTDASSKEKEGVQREIGLCVSSGLQHLREALPIPDISR